MRLRTAVLIIPLTFGFALTAYGQEGDAPPIRQITIEDPLEVSGERIGPEAVLFGQTPMSTSSLVDLRWSFVEKLIESVDEIP